MLNCGHNNVVKTVWLPGSVRTHWRHQTPSSISGGRLAQGRRGSGTAKKKREEEERNERKERKRGLLRRFGGFTGACAGSGPYVK